MSATVRLFLAVCVVLAMGSLCGYAETYYWDVESAIWGEFGVVENWKIGGAEGDPATVLPGGSDRLYSAQNFFFDLGGGSYGLKSWSTELDWTPWSLNLTNGVLRFNGDVILRHGDMHLYEGSTLGLGAETHFVPGRNSGSARKVYVNSGANLEVLGSKFEIYNMRLYIAADGRADLAHREILVSSGSEQSSLIENSGELVITNGLFLTAGGKSNSKLDLVQKAGVLVLGGDISQNNKDTKLNITLEGGSLVVVDDVLVEVNAAVISEGAEIEIDIASGKYFDMSSFEFGEGAVVTKSGDGVLRIGSQLPSALSVEAGGIECAVADQSYDLSDIEMAEGAEIVLGVPGITLAGVPLGEGYSFGANIRLTATELTLVSSENAELLARIKSDIEVGLDASMMVVQEGNSLIVKTAHVFNSTAVSEWNDPSGWECGYVPTGGDVYVVGSGVEVYITESIPVYDGIFIDNGACLVVEDSCELPILGLSEGAQLVVTNGATLGLLHNLKNSASSFESLPEVTIADGAKVVVPANSTFGNIGINLFGELESSGVGTLTFGYAGVGESTLFAMYGEGGSISMPSSGSYNESLYMVGCPAIGGEVVIPEPIIWQNLTLPSVTWQSLHGFRCGVNNPVENEFTLVLDDTWLRRGSPAMVEGGATICLTNGAVFDSEENNNLEHGLRIREGGQIIVNEGCKLVYLVTNGGHTAMLVEPDEEGYAPIVLRGGVARIFTTKGNDKGIFVGDGVLELYRDSNAVAVSRPFEGFARAEIPEGETLTVRGVTERNKSVLVADVPITGAGSMVVTNAGTGSFDLTVVSGLNSAEGMISACPESGVFFNDGANWAGTVVTEGSFGLTNIAAEAFFATASFESLNLQGDFPVRVGVDGSDKLKLGSGGFTGDGRLVVIGVDDYDYKDAGETILIGSVSKTAANLPKCVAQGMVLKLKEHPEDETRYNLWLSYGGTLFLVR